MENTLSFNWIPALVVDKLEKQIKSCLSLFEAFFLLLLAINGDLRLFSEGHAVLPDESYYSYTQ